MDKVSVIIPVYNKEKYVTQCIQSLLSQSYANLEIVVIDDGSTDSSFSLCTELAEYDERIRLVAQSNGGPAKARNAGLDLAIGDYITFVDADDYIAPDYIEKLMRYAEFDCVVSGYFEVNKEAITIHRSQSHIARGKDEIADLIFTKRNFLYIAGPYLKLYHNSVINTHKIRFKNITYGEDTAFVLEYLRYCESLIFIDYVGYYNRILLGTLSRKKIDGIYPMLQEVIAAGEAAFHYKYNKYWQFMYVRMIKITLANELNSYRAFRSTSREVIESEDFSYIKLSQCHRKTDLILYILLHLRLIFLLYIAAKLTVKGG